jgi:NAD(P)H-dependent flavin oxidoreductase YrpB (nitropropane dioxygenase family)
MGVAVSGWRLAASVARTGQLGVVSGTALAVVLARALARWAATPAEDVVRYLLAPAPTEGDR